MYPPVDYPVSDDEATSQRVDAITIAALRDRHEARQLITEAMIQSAHLRLEEAHQFPSAAAPKTLEPMSATPIYKRLLGVICQGATLQ